MGILALTRRPHEQIILTCANGTRITITVAQITGQQARIAIDAPASVTIDRAEIAARKEAERGAVWAGNR